MGAVEGLTLLCVARTRGQSQARHDRVRQLRKPAGLSRSVSLLCEHTNERLSKLRSKSSARQSSTRRPDTGKSGASEARRTSIDDCCCRVRSQAKEPIVVKKLLVFTRGRAGTTVSVPMACATQYPTSHR